MELPVATRRTVAWYPGEGNVHTHGETFSPTLVDNDGRVKVHPPVVNKLHGREREDNRRREDSHCSVAERKLLDTKLFCTIVKVWRGTHRTLPFSS